MIKNKKKFKDWGVVKFLKEKAPDLAGVALNLVGNILPGGNILSELGNKIRGSKELNEGDKVLALKKLDQDISQQKEITKRWEIDMNSDSWLSKNIRPLTLLYLLFIVALLCILDSCNVLEVKDQWVSLFGSLLLTTVGAYFGLREVGKFIKNKYKNK